jgi:hypothetical protein
MFFYNNFLQYYRVTEKPHPGKAWFDFNDSRVHPIYEKTIEKQFTGKESAYMLFYRKKSLVRPNTGIFKKSSFFNIRI